MAWLQLTQAGWVYDGLHNAGGGMGCHVCHEFTHPTFGRLAFEAAVSHQSSKAEWGRAEKNAPYRDFSDWFLMLDGSEFDWTFAGKVMRVDSGVSLDELESVLKERVLD